MGDKFYVLSEESLKELLYDSIKLTALEEGGVDNWYYYSDALCEFRRNFQQENPEVIGSYDDENLDEVIDLKTIAEALLTDYYTVSEIIDEVFNETLASELNL